MCPQKKHSRENFHSGVAILCSPMLLLSFLSDIFFSPLPLYCSPHTGFCLLKVFERICCRHGKYYERMIVGNTEERGLGTEDRKVARHHTTSTSRVTVLNWEQRHQDISYKNMLKAVLENNTKKTSYNLRRQNWLF